MKWAAIYLALSVVFTVSCSKQEMQSKHNISASEILGNPDYTAISYGGYRTNSREIQPTVGELMEDMKILHAMGIRILRTYNVHLPHASNVLKAIDSLRSSDKNFEMYVMLGAWIDCKNAWTDLPPDHDQESERNQEEIDKVVALAQEYPEIVKIIAVGNEAMVKWATAYYVQPGVILKYVNYLQGLKKSGKLSADLWITSSDNFASWGGGGAEYHVEDLKKLIHAVDYISVHTYPMHDTHYNPVFWGISPGDSSLSREEKIQHAMDQAVQYAIDQYEKVYQYMVSVGADKPIHIGETGWATHATGHYGPRGSRACDQYKEALYYNTMRAWTKANNIACFYFEAFDEPWKDAQNPEGSENHFGLFTVDGKAKYVLWQLVDQGVFQGLTRGGNPIIKTYEGNVNTLMKEVLLPPENELIKE